MEQGLFDACIGKGLYKKRVGINNRGKSSGFRTVVAFQMDNKVIFIYGFKKNERDNISLDEKRVYRRLAIDYLNLSNKHLNKMLKANLLIEVKL